MHVCIGFFKISFGWSAVVSVAVVTTRVGFTLLFTSVVFCNVNFAVLFSSLQL